MSNKIAVIGSGISGLVCAKILSKKYDVTLFESNSYLGGHTHTIDVTYQENIYPIDLGFIVFNKKTYPNFTKILRDHSVSIQKSEMSFSYRSNNVDFEYNGNNINTLFADRRNLYKLNFYRFLKEILIFNKHAKKFLLCPNYKLTILDFLNIHGYSKQFTSHYLIPMIAAIWSANPEKIFHSSAYFFMKFYFNHGLLDIFNRPKWYVIAGGSKQYIPKLIHDIKDQIYLGLKVDQVERLKDRVIIKAQGHTFTYHKVFIATHSNQALAMLKNPSPEEIEVLSKISFQSNELVLHTDINILPKRKLAWASWNYYDNQNALPTLTYYMNRLQNLSAPIDFLVSLNLSNEIDPSKILYRNNYYHPCFNHAALDAQKSRHLINGKQNTYYAGAYWGSGFHEDGVVSAITACALLGVGL